VSVTGHGCRSAAGRRANTRNRHLL
jgi:hypothetical protein